MRHEASLNLYAKTLMKFSNDNSHNYTGKQFYFSKKIFESCFRELVRKRERKAERRSDKEVIMQAVFCVKIRSAHTVYMKLEQTIPYEIQS